MNERKSGESRATLDDAQLVKYDEWNAPWWYGTGASRPAYDIETATAWRCGPANTSLDWMMRRRCP